MEEKKNHKCRVPRPLPDQLATTLSLGASEVHRQVLAPGHLLPFRRWFSPWGTEAVGDGEPGKAPSGPGSLLHTKQQACPLVAGISDLRPLGGEGSGSTRWCGVPGLLRRNPHEGFRMEPGMGKHYTGVCPPPKKKLCLITSSDLGVTPTWVQVPALPPASLNALT